jgi:uncharacterized cupin superfamily protein
MEPGITTTALDPDSSERFVRLRPALGVTTFGINQLVMQPGQRSRIHRHTHQEEVYLVLEGKLTLLAEDGFERELGQGELARVGHEVRRQLVNRHPERLVLLALGGAPPHDSRDGEAFLTWEQEQPSTPQEVPFPDDVPVDGR